MGHAEGRLIEAQEAERARVVAELHNNIAQRIAVMTMGLDLLDKALPLTTDEVRAKVRALSNQTRDLVHDVQALSDTLQPAHLELIGVVSASASFCRSIAAQRSIDVAFSAEGVPEHLPKNVALGIFRVVEEAVMNAVEHAGACRVVVGLRGSPGEIRIEIVDKGIGFDVEAARMARGNGLIGMDARVGVLGGDLVIQSRHGEGTVVRARVPLPPEAPTTDR